MKLSVIIPVYSEEDVLREVVDGLVERTKNALHQIILIVSPRSSEKTFAICQELEAKYPLLKYYVQEKNPGLGRAYKQAFSYVNGTHVLIIDADGEMDLNTVPKMVEAALGGYDLVLASRWIKGGRVYDYDPLTYILNRGFQYIFRLLFWTRVHDLTYGFKLFNARLIREVHWWGDWHEIAMETTLKPLKLGYRLVEIPTTWRKRKEGVSKINIWKRMRYVPFALKILFTPKANL